MQAKKFKALGPIVLLLSSCSTSNHLRKFDEADLGKQVSADVIKKFEVKEIDAAGTSKPSAPVAPVSKADQKKKAKLDATKQKASKKEVMTEPPLRRLDKMPFEIGEKLSYDIRYVGVTAGTFEVMVQSLKQIDSRQVYYLLGKAKTLPFFNMIYRVDDTIESFYDYQGMYSHRFTMDLDESKQNRKVIELYDYDKKVSYYWNRIDHVDKGFSEQREERAIQPWSQDLLSALYYLRVATLPTDPGPEFRFPVIVDGKPWESVVKFSKKGKTYANGKDTAANIYTMENFEGGVLKNKENTIWISDDDKRYILRVEAKVKVGSFAVALEKAQ
jgi:hypothetical protein